MFAKGLRMGNSLSFSRLEEWIMAFLIFILSTPMFTWDIIFIYYAAAVLFFFLSIKYFSANIKSYYGLLSILSLFCLYFLIYKYTPNAQLYVFIFTFFVMIPFFMMNPVLWSKVYKKYLLIFSITIIPSIIEYVLVSFFGLSLSSKIIHSSPLNPWEYPYRQYMFFVYMDSPWLNLVPRFYGFYDEPGVVGNIAMVFLFTERFNMRKWYNYPILIAGLLSFSLLFYASILFYILLFVKSKYKVIVFLLIGFTVYLSFDNPILYNLIYRRFEFSEGNLQGDTRNIEELTRWFNSLDTWDFLCGVDPGNRIRQYASIKYTIGVCGLISLFLFFFILFYRVSVKLGFTKDFLLYIMIISLIFYQRPFLNHPHYVFLMIVPFYVLLKQRIDTNITNLKI